MSEWTVVGAGTEEYIHRPDTYFPEVMMRFYFPGEGFQYRSLLSQRVVPPGRYRVRVLLECDDSFDPKETKK